MVAQLEQQWPRVAGVAVCLVMALWLAGQGGHQNDVRYAGDRLAKGEREAAARLARDIDSRPATLRAAVIEGDALTQLGRPAQAARAYQRAVDLSPNDWRLRRSLAVALADSGRVAAGQRQLARAEVLNPRIVIADQLPNPAP